MNRKQNDKTNHKVENDKSMNRKKPMKSRTKLVNTNSNKGMDKFI